jgi:PAS domain-containing serine/threonine kinase
LRKIDHPSIVKILDLFETKEDYLMVMELHGRGQDLFDYIDVHPRTEEPLARFLFRQIADAIYYLHSMGILHRDIKEENILIDDDLNAKLIDFGSAAYMAKGKLFSTFCGTIEYASPEVLLGNPYRGPELEIWALGVTLYTLLYGENPFFDIDETIAGNLNIPPEASPGVSFFIRSFGILPRMFTFLPCLEVIDLLQWMLCVDPTERATIDDVLGHAWVVGDIGMDAIVSNISDGDDDEGAEEWSSTTDDRCSRDSKSVGGLPSDSLSVQHIEDDHFDDEEDDDIYAAEVRNVLQKVK